jgi:hypothetical protein
MDTRDDALRSLQRSWGEVYEISEALGVWRSVRLRNGLTIVATDPVELRALIVRDYNIEKMRGQLASR